MKRLTWYDQVALWIICLTVFAVVYTVGIVSLAEYSVLHEAQAKQVAEKLETRKTWLIEPMKIIHALNDNGRLFVSVNWDGEAHILEIDNPNFFKLGATAQVKITLYQPGGQELWFIQDMEILYLGQEGGVKHGNGK